MKLRMPKFGRKDQTPATNPTLTHTRYEQSLSEAIDQAVTTLREADFCHPINGADKRVEVTGYASQQKAWYLTATSRGAYFLLENGQIVTKPDLWSPAAHVVSQRGLLAVEDEIKKGLQLIYTRPAAEEVKPRHTLVTEENEDDEGGLEEATTQQTTAESASDESKPWHRRLPYEKQGRQMW